jgi:hypothetical protein
MENPKEPTNADLYERLGKMEANTNAQLESILNQVKKTNGRVTRLEKWKERLDIIEIYKKENGAIIVPKEVDWQKLLLYALGLVGTALAIISYMAQSK